MASSLKNSLLKKNLYDLLEITQSATEADIKKAYRRKALKCHPDKNPDNPKAAELFHELSAALEILTDSKAKEAYDKSLKAKELAKERTKVLDAKRRKLKEDLERREQAAKDAQNQSSEPDVPNEEILRREIERLKKEGSRALQEEQELMLQQILKEQQEKSSIFVAKHDFKLEKKPRFKIKWSSGVSLDQDKLRDIFKDYGKITDMIVIKKSALIEFETQDSAEKAFRKESQNTRYNWKIEWVSKSEPIKPVIVQPTQPSAATTGQDFADFEAMILGQLSAAASNQNKQENTDK